jgi:hypothetical protein
MSYHRKYPHGIDGLNRLIGYRLRPAWVWTYGQQPHAGLIIGLANDGISGVPGVVRLLLLDQNGNLVSESILDAGHPTPHQVRLARLELPAGLGWKGTRLKGELIVKGVHHPLRWACREALNQDGSLTLMQSAIPL